MENSRRPFDRSREPGPKKPRLMEELDRVPNSGPRQFPQRQVASGITALSSARFRTNDRDLENSDFGRRGGANSGGCGYQPQPLPFQELVTQYKAALAELTFNSKPIITNLTIIAGENQAAEKAIAATVCANILEVPSDQKLPSLYLLDSIVKNIGRDYIKYFAARLPEVFCKAYRQVDSSVHQSMQHLFGTWKGVFPPQTLQAIEKELGFTPAVNGSSASSTLSRDSQSQRPPHSIHVNPKYLERQRLQQSGRTKGVIDDITGAISNSNDDLEMPGRTLGVARPWVDSNVTVNIHSHENDPRIRRDAFNDSVPEKSVGASYGSSEYNTNLSRNLVLGISRPGGRVTESGHDKSWYNKSGLVAGTEIGQRNGVSLKYNFVNTEAPKSMILDAHHQSTQNITSTRNSVISDSWKNSEEEEYTWDEMNSGLTVHRASTVSNLSKDIWTADDENLEDEDCIQIRNPFGASADREMPIESQATEKKHLPASRHHPSLLWQLQEQHSIDERNRKAGHSDRLMSTLGSIPANTNSSASRMVHRPLLPNATIGLPGIAGQYHSLGAENPSRQSTLRQRSPSPPGPFSSMTFQARHKQQLVSSRNEVAAKTEKPPVSKVPLARETKSNLDTGNLPSRLEVQSSRSGRPSPSTLISSASTIAIPSSLGSSSDNLSVLPKSPQRKAGQPPRASTLPLASSNVSSASVQTSNDTNNTLNPITNLLSTLVAKGLISAETESPTKVSSELLTRLEKQSDSITTTISLPVASLSGSAAVPVPSIKDEVDDTARTPISLSESTGPGIRNLIGFEFKLDVIREFHSSVISELFDDLPHHCSTCGLRLRFQEQFNRHLEWHATRESEQNGLISVSRWYLKSSDWIVGKAEYPSENEFTDSVDKYGKEAGKSQEHAMVLADENQCLCMLCGELFEDFYCQENGEWMFKGAVYLAKSDSNSEMGIRDMSTGRGPIIHASCFSDNSISSVFETD